MKEQSCALDILSSQKKDIWSINSTESTKYIADRQKQSCLQLFVMQDHDGAGKVWDRSYKNGTISQSTLVHVDAHDDLAIRFPLPLTLDELSGRDYEVGSYILPRVNVGIIKEIIWVKPLRLKMPPVDTKITSSSSLVIQFPQSILSPNLVNHPNVTVTSKIPKINADLINIDLDFFTHDLPEWYPSYFLKIKVKNFLTQLFSQVKNPKIITVAISPGYIQTGREQVLLDTTLDTINHLRQ